MTEVNKPPKIAILVDGNNFYRGLEKSELLKTSTQLDEFDYSKFAEFIAQGREIGIRKFYKGVVKKEIGNPKSQRMVSEQQRIFARLEFSDWKVVRGKLSKNPEFGRCEGFYFCDEDIEKNLRNTSKRILEEHRLAYNPIIVVSPNSAYASPLKQAVSDIRENAGLKKLNGIYFGNHFFI